MCEVTKEKILDEDNLTQCECGNYTPYEYSWSDENGTTCPTCMVEWLKSQINIYKGLMRDIADPELTEGDIQVMIKRKFSEIMMTDVESLDDDDDLSYLWEFKNKEIEE